MALDVAFVLAFAFGAGMVAFFSPCCAAMLPAYVSFALGRAEGSPKQDVRPPTSRARRELGALGLWAGAFVAALGLGRLALEALASLGGHAPATPPGERTLSVALATVGIALALAGTFATAARSRMRAGLLFGGVATLGFLATFTLVGLPVALLAPALTPAFGWVAAGVGLGLVALGLATLAGVRITLPLRSFSPEGTGLGGFFLFGVAYGIAALSCTFPIFLVVVSLALLSGGFLAAVAAFSAYALGKGAVMILVTVLSTASPAAVEGRIKRLLPRFDQAMAAVLIASGAFITYYFGFVYAVG
jgi:cytochrome c biogenesis protein CcdA